MVHGNLPGVKKASPHDARDFKPPRLKPFVHLPIITRRGVPTIALIPVRRLRSKAGNVHPITNSGKKPSNSGPTASTYLLNHVLFILNSVKSSET
jgi:hypothetical protein